MKMSAQMTVVAVLATLAYLGLAVWGIGGPAVFFSHGRWCWWRWPRY
jgi:hypothetical protein